MRKRKWKNVASYKEAKDWIQTNLIYPVWTETGSNQEIDVSYSLLISVWLLENAKNSAVRAAVHKEFIGAAYLQYREDDDGCAYYDPKTAEYLGRGRIRWATYIPDCSPEDCGYVLVEYNTPIQDCWLRGVNYLKFDDLMAD